MPGFFIAVKRLFSESFLDVEAKDCCTARRNTYRQLAICTRDRGADCL